MTKKQIRLLAAAEWLTAAERFTAARRFYRAAADDREKARVAAESALAALAKHDEELTRLNAELHAARVAIIDDAEGES